MRNINTPQDWVSTTTAAATTPVTAINRKENCFQRLSAGVVVSRVAATVILAIISTANLSLLSMMCLAQSRKGKKVEKPTNITTTVQEGMSGDARSAARRLAWECLARSLLSCVSSSHRSNSSGPNHSRGSISRTTRYT